MKLKRGEVQGRGGGGGGGGMSCLARIIFLTGAREAAKIQWVKNETLPVTTW